MPRHRAVIATIYGHAIEATADRGSLFNAMYQEMRHRYGLEKPYPSLILVAVPEGYNEEQARTLIEDALGFKREQPNVHAQSQHPDAHSASVINAMRNVLGERVD